MNKFRAQSYTLRLAGQVDVRMSYRDYSVGFKLATGELGPGQLNYYEDPETCHDTYYECDQDYRLGALYIGYKNYRFEWNSEAIRQNIQNEFAHDYLQKGDAKWFKVQKNVQPGFYANNSPYYRYSLW